MTDNSKLFARYGYASVIVGLLAPITALPVPIDRFFFFTVAVHLVVGHTAARCGRLRTCPTRYAMKGRYGHNGSP